MVRDDDARHFADVRPPSAVEGYRELPLPEPPSLAKMVGPGIIAVGIGMAAGEFILWPFAVIRGGLGLLWLALVTLVIQVFINMEIERYTLATGETAVAGFTRLWKPIGLLICLAGLFQYVFPGWATSAASVTAILTGGSVKWIAIGALVIVGLALTVSPVIYTLVERVEFFKVACTIVFLIVVVTSVISLSTWGEAGKSLVTNFGQIPEGISITLVLSLLGAAGAGGVHNLILSNWVRDKGYGMGAHVPKLVSPITGHEEPARGHAFHFPEDEANLSRWRVWWKRANIEHVSSFFLVCLITITIMSMLAYETVFGRTELGRQANAAFLEAQGEELGNQVGDWFKILFWVTCAISLFAAALGLLDVIGRLVSDVLKSTYLAENPISESRLYFIVVWGEIVLGSLILLAGLTQPIVLLTISTVAASVVTFFYTALLIRLNTSYRLPGSVRLRGFRLAMMCIAFLFYGFFATLLLVDQIRTNF